MNDGFTGIIFSLVFVFASLIGLFLAPFFFIFGSLNDLFATPI